MAKNVVAIKNAGFLMPDNYISRAIKDCGYLGVAVVHSGELVVNHSEKPSLDDMKKLQEAFKDSTAIFCFGENVKTRLDEDKLPFRCVLSKDKGDSVAVFLTGTFEGYAVKDSSHIDEFHCFDDFLSKKLQKIYKGAGSDLEEFLKELNDPITGQDISNSWTSRGFISMLASNGKAFHIFNRGNVFVRADWPWGIVSDGLGYEEKAEAPPKVDEKKPSVLDKILGKKAAEGKASVPPVAPPATATAVAAAVAAATSGEFETVKLPPEAKDWTNKQKITWWVAEIGYKPNGYKDMKTTMRRFKGTKKGEFHDLVDANGNLPVGVNTVKDAATPGTEERKITDSTAMDHKAEVHPNKVDPKTLPDKTEKVAPDNAKDTAPKHVLTDNLPIIGPKQKLLLRKQFLADAEVVKILGDDYQAMAMQPKQLKELEDNYQTFWDGLGQDKPFYLSFEALMKLGTLDIKSLAVLAFNNQNDRVKAEVKLASLVKANPNLKLAM